MIPKKITELESQVKRRIKERIIYHRNSESPQINIIARVEDLKEKGVDSIWFDDIELKSKLQLLKELSLEIEKVIDDLKFNTIHSGDEGTNCFIEVVRVDKLKQKLINWNNLNEQLKK